MLSLDGSILRGPTVLSYTLRLDPTGAVVSSEEGSLLAFTTERDGSSYGTVDTQGAYR